MMEPVQVTVMEPVQVGDHTLIHAVAQTCNESLKGPVVELLVTPVRRTDRGPWISGNHRCQSW